MEWERTLGENVGMLLVDFEKAYDRIEWPFILMVLEAFGFPKEFCRMNETLMKDSNAQIEINGCLTVEFELQRSIRQDCSLAHTLFVIVVDALHYILRDNHLTPKVNGLVLPNKQELINLQFVDDTTLMVKLEEENVRHLMGKLDFLEKAIGSRISKSKSIMLSQEETHPPCFHWLGLQWGGPSKIVRYLGIPFVVSPNLRDMWEWVKGKIEKKLNNWNN